jgi:anaerobic magnesium-protoporphyrin IX monomethyl ester cyclase
MKVALIAPPYPLTEAPSAPLGLCYVAAAFEAAGAEVIILDYIVRQYTVEKLGRELQAFGPNLVGITSVTLNFYQAAEILRTVRRVFPTALTVMGGPHVSFEYAATLAQYPEIDLIVIGEAEQTIADLMPVIDDRSAWRTISGLAFRDNGQLVVTPARERVRDLDRLSPPARHLLPLSRYLALGFPISIITSRGCPNRCIFCQGRRMVGSRIRNRHPEKVVDEIEVLIGLGFSRINFSDDFFTSNIDRVKAICAAIRQRSLTFTWTAFARADSVTPELLQTMRQAGCDTVFFGIESGHQAMLDRVRKRISLDRIRQAVADCKAAGMAVFGSFIVGLPGETRETLMDSHRFAQELDIMYGYHFLAPFPGTEVKERIDTYDLELLTDDWSRFDANSAIVRTAGLSAGDIEAFVDRYYNQLVRAEESRIERQFEQGTLSQAERLVYLGNRRLSAIFKLLTEDVIEQLSPVAIDYNGVKTETRLAETIASVLDQSEPVVTSGIERLFEQGWLRYRIEDRHAVCYWA